MFDRVVAFEDEASVGVNLEVTVGVTRWIFVMFLRLLYRTRLRKLCTRNNVCFNHREVARTCI